MDAAAELARIEKNGNKPEDWLDFIRRVKRDSPKYGYLMCLYDQAGRAVSPNEHRKNVCYARLLVEYAKLQGMTSADDARETFRIARCNVKRFAIVYIAWAQFELDKGNREKCRNHLLKGRTNRAEPSDILDQALKSCDQGNDRLLDDETEELIFTGVVTQTVKASLPLPTLMSDSELTTEKIGEENTSELPPKSDTGVVSFKLPYSTDSTCKQRQKIMSTSSSSGEDTITAPLHSILKLNRSMSTCKPSLKATPDCRNVGSQSLSNSMNLSSRKPKARAGIGKNFVFLGLPVRGRPTQLLEEVSEPKGEGENILDSFKAFEHTTQITSENSKQNVHSSEKLSSNINIDDRGKRIIEDCNNYDSNSCNINVPYTQELSNQANVLESQSKACKENEARNHINPDVLMLSNHSNPDSISVDKPVDMKCDINMSNNSAVSSQDNIPAVDKTMNTPDVSMLENRLPFDHPGSLNQDLNTSRSSMATSNNGCKVPPIEKQKQPSQDVPMSRNYLLESSKAAHQIYPSANNHSHGQDLQMPNSHFQPGVSNQGHPLVNKAAANGTHAVQELSLSENQPPNDIVNTHGYSKRDSHENQYPIRKTHATALPSNDSNPSRNQADYPKHAMGAAVDSQGQLGTSSSYLPSKKMPTNINNASKELHYNQCYPPPQTSAGNSNILVNGKSYLKLGAIGRGGSSKVFRAFDDKRDLVCAVKYVSLADADDFIVQSYINEITMLKRLQGSDYIIKLYNWEQKRDENCIILVLEYGSIDLAVFLRKNRSTFTETELTAYWKQMLEAVNVIHNEGIIHSDLKPANFLFVEGRLKLIDFGIANAIQADQTSIQRDTQVGTLNFMSPEAFQDISGSSHINANSGRSRPCTKIGRPSDVWSLGCILYNMVYGRTPFQHITNQAMKLQCIIDENYAIEFPPINNPQLLDVLKGCLIRNPQERYTIPHLLKHPFLCSGNKDNNPNEEQLFNCLLELAQAHVNSPNSIRIASKSICEQLRSGNKIDLSSILAKKQQHAARPLRQPLGGLNVEAMQHPHMKPSTTPYMGNERPFFDKENADLPFTGQN